MPVEGPNLQGANVRQVVVQADVALQAQMVRKDAPSPESVVRPAALLHERLAVERNQSVGKDMFVQNQEDGQSYNAGDALNGNGRREPGSQERRRGDEEPEAEAGDAEPAEGSAEWSELGDPREAQERLLKGLAELPLAQAPEVFGPMDRHLLSGLLVPEGGAAVAAGLAAYRRQTVQIQPGPEAFREAVHAAWKAADSFASAGGAEERERARKLVSVARQGVRAEHTVGRELAAFLDEALFQVSRAGGAGALRAVGLLVVVDTAISLWRESRNVGTVQPWTLR